jgi:hypothetical protein
MTHINRFGNGFFAPALIEYECVHGRPSAAIAMNESAHRIVIELPSKLNVTDSSSLTASNVVASFFSATRIQSR